MTGHRLFDFRHTADAGVHTYSCSASVTLEAMWPGLWEQEYPGDTDLNPYLRFGINNGDGEPQAVWRAFAWAITNGTSRFAIPNYYGDVSAKALGHDPEAVDLVDWEYDVDVGDPSATFASADRGFVHARHVVPLQPEPTEWESSTRSKARVLPLRSLADLHQLARSTSEATSEITIFGLVQRDRHGALLDTLRGSTRPRLSDVIEPGDVLVDIALDHDGFGMSHLSVRSRTPLTTIHDVAAHFDRALERYVATVKRISGFNEFAESIEDLTRPPD